jgi:hypothetical protein
VLLALVLEFYLAAQRQVVPVALLIVSAVVQVASHWEPVDLAVLVEVGAGVAPEVLAWEVVLAQVVALAAIVPVALAQIRQEEITLICTLTHYSERVFHRVYLAAIILGPSAVDLAQVVPEVMFPQVGQHLVVMVD